MCSYRINSKPRLGLILLLALIVGGCGQKGALYLPDEETGGAAAQRVDGTFYV